MMMLVCVVVAWRRERERERAMLLTMIERPPFAVTPNIFKRQ